QLPLRGQARLRQLGPLLLHVGGHAGLGITEVRVQDIAQADAPRQNQQGQKTGADTQQARVDTQRTRSAIALTEQDDLHNSPLGNAATAGHICYHATPSTTGCPAHDLSSLAGSDSRRAAARRQTPESPVRRSSAPRAAPGAPGKPVATCRPPSLPCRLLARRLPAADHHRWPLGHSPALSATAPAAPTAGSGGVREPIENPLQGATSSRSAT